MQAVTHDKSLPQAVRKCTWGLERARKESAYRRFSELADKIVVAAKRSRVGLSDRVRYRVGQEDADGVNPRSESTQVVRQSYLGAAKLHNMGFGDLARAQVKYTLIFVPVILILALIAVRLYRPPPATDAGAAPKAAITCEPSPGCR